jgi:hypothetical protein
MKTLYHPSSGRPPRIEYFDEMRPVRPIPPPQALEENPVAPFSCLADFKLAEHVVRYGRSASAVDNLLNNIHGPHWFSGSSAVTFKNHRDLQAALNRASEQFQSV